MDPDGFWERMYFSDAVDVHMYKNQISLFHQMQLFGHFLAPIYYTLLPSLKFFSS